MACCFHSYDRENSELYRNRQQANNLMKYYYRVPLYSRLKSTLKQNRYPYMFE